jgi:hypothetical protein
MGYFNYLPNIGYRDDSGNLVLAKNILTRAKILDIVKEAQGTALDYTIKDEERPETIAHRIYGRSDYHWIILMFNEILDPYFSWPLSVNELETQMEKTYTGKSLFVYPPLLWDRKSGKQEDGEIVPFDRRLPHFEVGDTVVQKDRFGKQIASGKVKSWDPNLYKIEVEDITGIFKIQGTLVQLSGQAIARPEDIRHDLFSITRTGREVAAQVFRVVDDNRYALHHFETSSGEVLSPLYRPVYLIDVNQDGEYERSESPSALIDRFVVGNTEVIDLGVNTANENFGYVTAVTNIVHESEVNDAKRTVKIMRPEYIDPVLRDFRRLFQINT